MTSEPLTEPLSPTLIERYLCTRGSRYFRGAHDGEYFYVANTRPRRLHVHLEIATGHHDVLLIRVAPVCFFPASDRPWLTHLADTWNRQEREVTAIVHGSSDPQRIGVVARRSQWIRGRAAFEDFATFVDATIAAAIEFFGELAPVVEQPSMAQPLVLDAG
jgi:Putative bacterial sensory transduction regulator